MDAVYNLIKSSSLEVKISLANMCRKLVHTFWTQRFPVPFPPLTCRPIHCFFSSARIHLSIHRRGPHSCMINLLLMQKACTAQCWCPRRNDATDSFWGGTIKMFIRGEDVKGRKSLSVSVCVCVCVCVCVGEGVHSLDPGHTIYVVLKYYKLITH